MTRLNRSGSLKDLHVLSFDLRTVTFAYAPGNTAAITYTPQDDSYQVSFSADQGTSPHDMLAGLLSHHLNELTREPKRVGKSSTGERFISVRIVSRRRSLALMCSCCAIHCLCCKRSNA